MTEWKTTVYIWASSQRSIAAQQKIVLADGSLCSRLCRNRVAAKILVFRNFAKFLHINQFCVLQNFPQISWNFAKFKQNSSKFHVSRNLNNAVSQQPYVEVEEEEGGGSGEWGARRIPPCAPSLVNQIVPISPSIYNVFHSVIYNSVALFIIELNLLLTCFELSALYVLANKRPCPLVWHHSTAVDHCLHFCFYLCLFICTRWLENKANCYEAKLLRKSCKWKVLKANF